MKYIKDFKSKNSSDIKKLANHLKEFFNNNQNEKIYVSSYEYDYCFGYNVDETDVNYFLNLKLNNDEILFDIYPIMHNPDWIPEKIENLSRFMKYVMDKYTEFGIINCSNVDKITKDITQEKYELYLQALKFNV